MGAEGQDRRIIRTKRLLKQALLGLVQEKDYSAITIQEICERADVGRSTFYTHFTSKEDLFFRGFDAWLIGLAGGTPHPVGPPPIETGPDRVQFSLPLLQHVATQRQLLVPLLLESADAGVRRRFLQIITEAAETELERIGRIRGSEAVKKSRRRAGAHVLAGAFLGFVTWWVDEGSAVSPQDADALFQQIAADLTAPA